MESVARLGVNSCPCAVYFVTLTLLAAFGALLVEGSSPFQHTSTETARTWTEVNADALLRLFFTVLYGVKALDLTATFPG